VHAIETNASLRIVRAQQIRNLPFRELDTDLTLPRTYSKEIVMGNNPSGARCTSSHAFRRTTGSLGLSKIELDARCKPTGLYDSCKWEQRHIRRVIADGKIAARLEGTEARVRDSDQECPICFLHYTDINMLQCCNATICTECYLQVQEPPRSQTPANPCPFCNHDKIAVKIAKKLDGDDVAKRDEEEQIVIEASIRARKDSISSVNSCGSSSRLLTPDERHNLEEEMRSQSAHPIMTQIRRQEEQQRDTHDREHNRRSGDGYSMFQREFLMRRGMEALNNLGDDEAGGIRRTLGGSATQLGRPGNGGLNDLFLIEAALLLSMQNGRGNSRSMHAPSRAGTAISASATSAGDINNNDNPMRNPMIRSDWEYSDRNNNPLVRSGFLGEDFPPYSDDDQMAMAIAMSLREEEAVQQQNRDQSVLSDVEPSPQQVLDDQSSHENYDNDQSSHENSDNDQSSHENSDNDQLSHENSDDDAMRDITQAADDSERGQS